MGITKTLFSLPIYIYITNSLQILHYYSCSFVIVTFWSRYIHMYKLSYAWVSQHITEKKQRKRQSREVYIYVYILSDCFPDKISHVPEVRQQLCIVPIFSFLWPWSYLWGLYMHYLFHLFCLAFGKKVCPATCCGCKETAC